MRLPDLRHGRPAPPQRSRHPRPRRVRGRRGPHRPLGPGDRDRGPADRRGRQRLDRGADRDRAPARGRAADAVLPQPPVGDRGADRRHPAACAHVGAALRRRRARGLSRRPGKLGPAGRRGHQADLAAACGSEPRPAPPRAAARPGPARAPAARLRAVLQAPGGLRRLPPRDSAAQRGGAPPGDRPVHTSRARGVRRPRAGARPRDPGDRLQGAQLHAPDGAGRARRDHDRGPVARRPERLPDDGDPGLSEPVHGARAQLADRIALAALGGRADGRLHRRLDAPLGGRRVRHRRGDPAATERSTTRSAGRCRRRCGRPGATPGT